jgi:hypothetical protein
VENPENLPTHVTPADVDAVIASEWFFTGREAAFASDGPVPAGMSNIALGQLTFCMLVLKNGFTVTGESYCASPEKYDRDIGRKYARQQATNKVSAFLGFMLKNEIARSTQGPKP